MVTPNKLSDGSKFKIDIYTFNEATGTFDPPTDDKFLFLEMTKGLLSESKEFLFVLTDSSTYVYRNPLTEGNSSFSGFLPGGYNIRINKNSDLVFITSSEFVYAFKQVCDSGYSFVNGMCQTCSVSNCTACESATACSACSEGFTLENGKCTENFPYVAVLVPVGVVVLILIGVGIYCFIKKSEIVS